MGSALPAGEAKDRADPEEHDDGEDRGYRMSGRSVSRGTSSSEATDLADQGHGRVPSGDPVDLLIAADERGEHGHRQELGQAQQAEVGVHCPSGHRPAYR